MKENNPVDEDILKAKETPVIIMDTTKSTVKKVSSQTKNLHHEKAGD